MLFGGTYTDNPLVITPLIVKYSIAVCTPEDTMFSLLVACYQMPLLCRSPSSRAVDRGSALYGTLTSACRWSECWRSSRIEPVQLRAELGRIKVRVA